MIKFKPRREVQKETILHWEKMIGWAKGRNPDYHPNHNSMRKAIKTDWYGKHCPHCAYYYNEDDETIGCTLCPLYDELYEPGGGCCAGRWDRVNQAMTWRNWIDYAEDLLRYVKKYGAKK